jgi:small multidrug resistance pump
MMSWFYLAVAILLEVVGTINMKLSQGFTRWLPTTLMFVLYGLSIAAMNISLKGIDVGVVYAIWSGVGTALITLAGVLWFHEQLTALRVVSIALIIIGVIGLNIGLKEG